MSIGRYIRDDDIVALGDAGSQWFRQMCDVWMQRTRYNPVKVCREIMAADRKRIFWNRCTAGGVLSCFALLIVALIWSNVTGRVNAPDSYFWASLALPTLGISVFWWAQARVVPVRCPWGDTLYPLMVREIKNDLSSFFLWGEHQPEDYNGCDLMGLRTDARAVLVRFALKVVEHEHVVRQNRKGNWGMMYDKLKGDLDNAHASLKRLGIANRTPTEYYREAERRFAAGEKAPVET